MGLFPNERPPNNTTAKLFEHSFLTRICVVLLAFDAPLDTDLGPDIRNLN